MKEPKSYRTDVRVGSDYDEIPSVAVFSIQEETAQRIVRLASIVMANDLHKVSRFDYRTQWLKHDPEKSPEDAESAGEENEVNTDADTLNVSATEFWFSASIKHADVGVLTERQSIADLAMHFEIELVPTSAGSISVPSDVIASLIDMSKSHVDDIASCIEDGTYDAAENLGIGKKRAAVEMARSLYRNASMGVSLPGVADES